MKVVSYLAQMQDQTLGTQFPVKKKKRVPLDHTNNKRDPFAKLTINCFSSFKANSTACLACIFFMQHFH